jgi:hypothetical protein
VLVSQSPDRKAVLRAPTLRPVRALRWSRVQGVELRAQGLGFRVRGLGFKGFRVQG